MFIHFPYMQHFGDTFPKLSSWDIPRLGCGQESILGWCLDEWTILGIYDLEREVPLARKRGGVGLGIGEEWCVCVWKLWAGNSFYIFYIYIHEIWWRNRYQKETWPYPFFSKKLPFSNYHFLSISEVFRCPSMELYGTLLGNASWSHLLPGSR